MYESIRLYINKITSSVISDEEFKHVEEAFQPKKVKKRQFLSHEGSVCQHLAFIVNGAMRQYVIDSKGVEHIIRFGIEGWWMIDRESFSMLIPSKYNIEAVEDSDLLITTKEKVTHLKDRSPLFLKMMQVLDENNFIANHNRIEANISFTAEEKFQQLMKSNPAFIRRFPQTMLASYLGISPETLSRIRKQMYAKKE